MEEIWLRTQGLQSGKTPYETNDSHYASALHPGERKLRPALGRCGLVPRRPKRAARCLWPGRIETPHRRIRSYRQQAYWAARGREHCEGIRPETRTA